MKQIFVKLIFLLVYSGSFAQTESPKKIVLFDIKEDISPSASRISTKAIFHAEKIEADLIIVHMNTYGGYVTDADSIRTRLLNTDIPVYVFIDNNAASAGALISLACDKIYMRPGGSIGAATVVGQDGQAAPDKYQSYMRKQMRSTAESHGYDTTFRNGDTILTYKRNPDIAEGMVDPRVVVEGLDDSSKVITLTTEEAIIWGYCEGKAESIEDILLVNNITNYDIIKVEKSGIDKLVGFFANPVLRGIFIMLMLGGLYFELQSPGIGFPLAVSVLSAVLYFAPLYIDGLAANWEILLFVVGMVLLGVELFAIPGFGVAGISGLVIMLFSLVLSMLNNDVFDFSTTSSASVSSALAVVFLSLIGFIGGILIFGRSLLKSGLFQRIVLADTLQSSKINLQEQEKDLDELIGTRGIAHTAFRPAGKIKIGDEIWSAKTYGQFADKGTELEVISIENQVLIVTVI